MAGKNPDEVRKELIEKLGEEFGADLFNLQNAYFNVRIEWRFYRSLFGTNKERIDLLNAVSGIFFRTLEVCLFEAVILGLCRLTDPLQSGRGERAKLNMTFRRLENHLLTDEEHQRFTEFLGEIEEASEFARDWRNRKISHSDYFVAQGQAKLEQASREKLQLLLDKIGELLQWVYKERLKVSHVLDASLSIEDEMRVLELLYDAIQGEEAEKRRLEKCIEEKDFKSLPLAPERPEWLRRGGRR